MTNRHRLTALWLLMTLLFTSAAIPRAFASSLDAAGVDAYILTDGADALPVKESSGYIISEHRCGKTGCYWETPMDIADTEAVWRMLTAPITVIDGNERTQVYLYEEPSEESKRVAEVTCASQGVHVLETRDDGWSKIECYSSSFHDSRVKRWNALSEGYVRTELLAEKDVKTT